MQMVMDDKAIDAIIAKLMELQDKEPTELAHYEQQLREATLGINNLLNAIQQGILTPSTKQRLEELEAIKEDMEIKIASEQLQKPKISEEFMRFYLHKFRTLDVTKKEHRKMLVDTFINAIFLYDDKVVITFNFKDGEKTITLQDITSSDIDLSGAPQEKSLIYKDSRAFFVAFLSWHTLLTLSIFIIICLKYTGVRTGSISSRECYEYTF